MGILTISDDMGSVMILACTVVDQWVKGASDGKLTFAQAISNLDKGVREVNYTFASLND